jgi:G3E family GTPase
LSPLPVTILGGYLGAGKTTLVNALLRRAGGLRLAVLVNDFGALPIDADLIEGREGDMLTIAGGCICCSYGSDLVGALLDLAARRPGPDHVLIETSGVALPGAVARSLGLVAGLSLDGIVVLADAETLPARAADRYLADTIARQIEAADLLLLTKLDLLSPEAAASRRAWASDNWPQTRVAEASRGDVPPDLVLGLSRGDRPVAPMAAHPLPGYATMVMAVEQPVVDVQAFAAALAQASPLLLRAKGFVTGVSGARFAIQVVGRRAEVSPAPDATMSPDALVCIGLAGMPREAVLAAPGSLAALRELAPDMSRRWPAPPQDDARGGIA